MQETGGIIDKKILIQLIDDVGLDNAEAVLDAFLDELESQARILVAAAHENNLDRIAEAAHRLKSTTASIGANAMNNAVISMEQAAKTTQLETIDQLIGGFQTLADKTVKEMAVIRQGLLA
ncbi:MAG: Hpt domain-containing protein [Rhodothermales bacterium]